MTTKLDITCHDLHELLEYDAVSGLFQWRWSHTRRFSVNKRHAGREAGHVMDNGYVTICVLGRAIKAHRIAWCMHHGEWPVEQIDHINRNRSDNRICNLRPCTPSQNSQNRKSMPSSSGVPGVRKHHNRWRACIKIDGRQKHLGCFDTAEAAFAAYSHAKTTVHPFFSEKP